MTTLENQMTFQKLQTILKFTFGLVPIAAGADKFLNLLTQWDQYLSPSLTEILPFPGSTFMMIVGVIEILAGILVLTKTKLGATIVSAWLLLIALTLVFSWHRVDVAVRDIVMAIGAYVLVRLTAATQTVKAKN